MDDAAKQQRLSLIRSLMRDRREKARRVVDVSWYHDISESKRGKLPRISCGSRLERRWVVSTDRHNGIVQVTDLNSADHSYQNDSARRVYGTSGRKNRDY
jgi:hypothetical protein